MASEVIDQWLVKELDRLRREVMAKSNYVSPSSLNESASAQRRIGARMLMEELRNELSPSDAAPALEIAERFVADV